MFDNFPGSAGTAISLSLPFYMFGLVYFYFSNLGQAITISFWPFLSYFIIIPILLGTISVLAEHILATQDRKHHKLLIEEFEKEILPKNKEIASANITKQNIIFTTHPPARQGHITTEAYDLIVTQNFALIDRKDGRGFQSLPENLENKKP